MDLGPFLGLGPGFCPILGGPDLDSSFGPILEGKLEWLEHCQKGKIFVNPHRQFFPYKKLDMTAPLLPVNNYHSQIIREWSS